ncbi:MAG: MFS transporter [Propionibacterium sp.]|nr:MFS transporter [Propionibacterium sp.]
MELVTSMRRLWRHALFRRLFAVRLVTQAADGCLQVGMASYILFSPTHAPDAWSIALALAVTLMPFSIVGPLVGVVLDRWNRRTVIFVTDAIRVVAGLVLAGLVATGLRTTVSSMVFFGIVLVAMSLNRFLMAGLGASLAHTVDDDEYLLANSVISPVGPLGVVIGAGIAAAVRLGLDGVLESYQADAFIFIAAAIGFALSALIATRFEPNALGPDVRRGVRVVEVLRGLQHAAVHLYRRRPALLGIAALGAHRVVYGLVMTGAILIHRNHLNGNNTINEALAQLGVWAGATGAGYLLAAVVTPLGTQRFGVRVWIILLTVVSALVQAFPGSWFVHPALVVTSFVLGICIQSLKNCVDTLAQAHIDDGLKGRVFTLFDMVFNTAMVLGAVLGALLLPADGASGAVFLGASAAFALIAIGFASISQPIGSAEFNRGTHRARTHA